MSKFLNVRRAADLRDRRARARPSRMEFLRCDQDDPRHRPAQPVTWGNPHGTAQVVWQKRTWDVVLAPTARMEARGLTRAMLTSAKPVTLIGYPRRDGTAEMRIETVLAGGKTVELR